MIIMEADIRKVHVRSVPPQRCNAVLEQDSGGAAASTPYSCWTASTTCLIRRIYYSDVDCHFIDSNWLPMQASKSLEFY